MPVDADPFPIIPHPVNKRAITYGLEEEVFVLHGGQTQLGSLWNMGQLLWQDPQRNWAATATNFRRGAAAKRELMSSVEVSTPVEFSAATLFVVAMSRRAALSRVFGSGQLIALGALPNSDRYHTAGLHIHIGVSKAERQRVYNNLVYFLPILALASASSPYFGGGSQGPLSRVASSFALGLLGSDPYDRFQDIIITRRLGTIELRVLDPVPDPERLWAILQAVERIAQLPGALPQSRQHSREHDTTLENALLDGYSALEDYNALRVKLLSGDTPALLGRAAELFELTGFAPHWLTDTEAMRVQSHTEAHGWASTCAHLDGLYRSGIWQDMGTPHAPLPAWQGYAGFARYYLPKLPYIARKAYVENKK